MLVDTMPLSVPCGTSRDMSVRQAELVLNKLFPERDIKRVLLVNPPDADPSFFQDASAKRRRYGNFPPYGLAVLAQHLKSINVEVRISNLTHEILRHCIDESENGREFDFEAVWQEKLDADILVFQPDLIGVTCMFTMTHNSLRNVCMRASSTGIPVAIGGVHVTNDVERVLGKIQCADIAFIGEADLALKRFVRVVNSEIGVTELAQVILADGGEHHCFLQNCQPSAEDISIIPAYELLDDIGEYSKYGTVGSFYWFKGPETRAVTVLSNRGCRAQCTFCSVRNFNGRGVRQRTIQSVVDELELLQNEYGVDHIMWLDDDLLKDQKRTILLFNEMVKRGLHITWDATNGLIAAACTDEVIAAAVESGCIGINIGMESGNREILRQIKKPGTVENFLRAAELFRKYEQIFASVFLMIGFPGETMSMIDDTIRVAREMDMDWYRIMQLQPLPNTPMYDDMVAEGLIPEATGHTRYTVGAYGTVAEMEEGRLTSSSVKDAFGSIPWGAVPTSEQLNDVWFYMDYHLNYHRLLAEKRPGKIAQQMQMLQRVYEINSPENAFALYFYTLLDARLHEKTDEGHKEHLRAACASSPYWASRLVDFGLSVEDLKDRNLDGES